MPAKKKASAVDNLNARLSLVVKSGKISLGHRTTVKALRRVSILGRMNCGMPVGQIEAQRSLSGCRKPHTTFVSPCACLSHFPAPSLGRGDG